MYSGEVIGRICSRLAVGAVLLMGLATTLLAQSVSEPPPSMTFDPWREVSQTETSTEYLVTFPSAVTTAYLANNTVPLRVFVPERGDEAIPVVLILHYWGATDLRAERSLALDLNRRGIGAAIMTLPYHLARTPPGQRSGSLAIQPNPGQMRETMTQAVMDVRRSLDFLESRPEFRGKPMGIAGTSLGAVITALSYAVDSRIQDAVFLLGGVDLAKIVWKSSLLVKPREVLRHRGYTESRLRYELAPVEPLNYKRENPRGQSLVIAGQYDTVIPREATEELIRSLNQPSVVWIDTGHYGGIFVQRRLMREVASFFDHRFTNTPYVAPQRFYAPTVRAGMTLSTPDGFDLGVGLDIWRSNARGDSYATVFVTPRGPQIFAGKQWLAPGLAFGVMGSARRVGVGMFWSAVL